MCSDNSGRSAGDKGQNLLGKGDDDTTRQGQKAVGTLGGVVALEGEAHLDDAPAQQDQAHSADQAENELGQVVDDGERVAARSGRGKGRHGEAAHQGHRSHPGAVVAVAALHLVGHGQTVLVGKPVPQEDELRWKSARLAELDAQLNIDGGPVQEEQAIAKSARPSVLEGLKRPLPPKQNSDRPKNRQQERER